MTGKQEMARWPAPGELKKKGMWSSDKVTKRTKHAEIPATELQQGPVATRTYACATSTLRAPPQLQTPFPGIVSLHRSTRAPSAYLGIPEESATDRY
jgi:hypothetical protein